MSGDARNHYSTTFKQKAVQYAKDHSKSKAARQFGIKTRLIDAWWKQKEAEKKEFNGSVMPGTPQRLPISKSKSSFRSVSKLDMENLLLQWCARQTAQGLLITAVRLRKAADNLQKEASSTTPVSKRWFKSFCTRYGNYVCLRKSMSPNNGKRIDPLVDQFLNTCSSLRLQRHYPLNSIGHMDEISLWETNDTISSVNKRMKSNTSALVPLYTVLLSALASGKKFPPLVMFKRNEPSFISSSEPNCLLDNNETVAQWLHLVWRTQKGRRRMLVWDSGNGTTCSHLLQQVAGQYATDVVFVPPGVATLLKPSEVAWNEPFRTTFRSLYDSWLKTQSFTLTADAKFCEPPRKLLLKWIVAAWASVPPETIAESFTTTGISSGLSRNDREKLKGIDLGTPMVKHEFMSDDDSDVEFLGFSKAEIELSHKNAVKAKHHLQEVNVSSESENEAEVVCVYD